jgi:hypothetical protein
MQISQKQMDAIMPRIQQLSKEMMEQKTARPVQ